MKNRKLCMGTTLGKALPVMAILASAFVAAAAQAGTPTTYLEEAGIVGQDTALKIFRMPVANSAGKITYYDVEMDFAVSATGVPALAGAPFIQPSLALKTNHFVPGRYFVKYSGQATEFGDLSSGVGTGGATVWSLAMEQNPDGDFPDQATWQTGAPSPDVEARLKAAKVNTNPNYSYGLTAVGGAVAGGAFNNDGLLAAEQVNGALTLFSYTDSTGKDQPTVQGSIVFTLCANAACSNAPK
jgi:hypothetical protein